MVMAIGVLALVSGVALLAFGYTFGIGVGIILIGFLVLGASVMGLVGHGTRDRLPRDQRQRIQRSRIREANAKADALQRRTARRRLPVALGRRVHGSPGDTAERGEPESGGGLDEIDLRDEEGTEDAGARRHRVVIVGSGFGGLFAAKHLRRLPVDVTLLSRTSHHLFQPLLYQVATGVLSEGEVAPATREILRRQDDAEVLLGDVVDIDVARREVVWTSPLGTMRTPYDSLVVAAGAGPSYFGHEEFAEYAPGMKSIDEALELRARIFGAFELAETATDERDVERLLTFVIVGAGPTGVEMAGQIAELAHRTLRRDFRRIDPTRARIVLLDAADTALGGFDAPLADAAVARLRRMGVEVRLGEKVVGVDADGVDLLDRDGGHHRIAALCKMWAAGVQASPLARLLAERTGARVDRAGRIQVEPDLTLPGHPEVFVVGDMAALDHLPGVAQVAMQGAAHAAQQIGRRIAGRSAGQPFHYRDKGSMATVSRFYAIASIGPLRLSGFLAWLMWLGVHLVYLIGFKNRVTTLLHWAVSFVGRGRSERPSTVQQFLGRTAMHHLHDLRPDLWRPVDAGNRPAPTAPAVGTDRTITD